MQHYIEVFTLWKQLQASLKHKMILNEKFITYISFHFHFGAAASFSKGVIMFAKLRTTFPIINWLEDLGSYFQSCFVIAAKRLRTSKEVMMKNV